MGWFFLRDQNSYFPMTHHQLLKIGTNWVFQEHKLTFSKPAWIILCYGSWRCIESDGCLSEGKDNLLILEHKIWWGTTCYHTWMKAGKTNNGYWWSKRIMEINYIYQKFRPKFEIKINRINQVIVICKSIPQLILY